MITIPLEQALLLLAQADIIRSEAIGARPVVFQFAPDAERFLVVHSPGNPGWRETYTKAANPTVKIAGSRLVMRPGEDLNNPTALLLSKDTPLLDWTVESTPEFIRRREIQSAITDDDCRPRLGEAVGMIYDLEQEVARLQQQLARYETLGTRPPIDPDEVSLLEVELPVGMDDQFRSDLDKILTMMCRRYESDNPGRVMWVFGCGRKPRFSQADALFLGRLADPAAPATGEPTYDPSVFCVELFEREDIHGRNPKL